MVGCLKHSFCLKFQILIGWLIEIADFSVSSIIYLVANSFTLLDYEILDKEVNEMLF